MHIYYAVPVRLSPHLLSALYHGCMTRALSFPLGVVAAALALSGCNGDSQADDPADSQPQMTKQAAIKRVNEFAKLAGAESDKACAYITARAQSPGPDDPDDLSCVGVLGPSSEDLRGVRYVDRGIRVENGGRTLVFTGRSVEASDGYIYGFIVVWQNGQWMIDNSANCSAHDRVGCSTFD